MEEKVVTSEYRHLALISKCHIKTFPTSLATALGPRFVKFMFSWYLSSDKVFIFHLENASGECLGYCGGIVSDGTLGTGSASGMAQHTFKAAIWAFVTHPWVIFHMEIREKWPLIFRNIKTKLGLAKKNHFTSEQKMVMSLDPSVGLVVIGVDPNHQGKGYGSVILKEFERLAVEKFGIYKLKLSVKSDNKTAIRAYEKNGWQPGEKNQDSLSMTKLFINTDK